MSEESPLEFWYVFESRDPDGFMFKSIDRRGTSEGSRSFLMHHLPYTINLSARFQSFEGTDNLKARD